MRTAICILNLIAALCICLTYVAVTYREGFDAIWVIPLVMSTIWVVSAAKLFTTAHLWPWLLSVVAVLMGLGSGLAGIVQCVTLIRRAVHGDRSIHLDPSTVGIPLFGFCFLAVGSLVLLTALLKLRSIPRRKGEAGEDS